MSERGYVNRILRMQAELDKAIDTLAEKFPVYTNVVAKLDTDATIDAIREMYEERR